MPEKKERFEPGLKLARHKELGEYLEGKLIAPINVEISPSGRCNAACEWCFYRQNPHILKGLDNILFKESRMEKLIEEFVEFGVKSISWTGGGEPALHPSFSKFVEWTNQAKLKQGLFTNGLSEVTYDPTLFEWIRVSKTNYDWNIDVLKILRGCKTLGLCINYRGKIDDKTILDSLKIVEKLENSKYSSNHSTYLQVRPALKIMGKKVKMEIPKIKHPLLKITDYKFLGANSERSYDKCEAYHFAPFIWQDGDVDVCGYHRKDSRFNLGNLYSEGKEGSFRYIMEKAPKAIDVVDNCQICCKLNSMNSMINLMRNLEDIDFP